MKCQTPEFIKYVITKAHIETNLPEVVKPEHFKNIKDLQEVYSGLLKNSIDLLLYK